jgi:hypothetical protein
MEHAKKNAVEDRIMLEGMVFYGNHGTLPAERELGQPFVIDIELYLDLQPAGLSDDLTQTVDYSEVHRRTKRIVEGPPVNLTGSYPGGSFPGRGGPCKGRKTARPARRYGARRLRHRDCAPPRHVLSLNKPSERSRSGFSHLTL